MREVDDTELLLEAETVKLELELELEPGLVKEVDDARFEEEEEVPVLDSIEAEDDDGELLGAELDCGVDDETVSVLEL